jgi:DNA mismatch endonuclease (patch repair protein)
MDIVDAGTRSRMMSSVRSKDTRFETEIRRRIFEKGFRYRLHRRDMPGTPDIVFPKYHAVILLHGCFWHLHGCARSKLPKTRTKWWKEKLETNRRRDYAVLQQLADLNWRVMVVWECSYRKAGMSQELALDSIAEEAIKFLKSKDKYVELPAPGSTWEPYYCGGQDGE